MSERITIVVDTENVKKLRKLQADMIRNSVGTVSFSRVVNLVLVKGLKK